MKAFLRENLVLVAGISLPVVLALVFMLATYLQNAGMMAPQYKVLFATNYFKQNGYNNYPYTFIIEDNTVVLNYEPQEKGNWHNRLPQLYLFDPATQITKQIDVPKIRDQKEAQDIIVTGVPKGEYTTTDESPDGFIFEKSYRGSGNLMTEIFGGGYRKRSEHALRKNGFSMRVPESKPYNTELIAWVKQDG